MKYLIQMRVYFKNKTIKLKTKTHLQF